MWQKAIEISEDKYYNDKLGPFNLPENVGHHTDAVGVGVEAAGNGMWV